jgi:hypothetical protein
MAKKNNAQRRERDTQSNTQVKDQRSDAEIAQENEQNTNLSETSKVVDRRIDPATGEKRFADPLKYDAHVGRAKESQLEYDPQWAKREVEFVTGIRPKGNGLSVMSKIFSLVESHMKANDGKGIVGSELAVALRNTDFPANRSKYTNGIPPVGWAEDYINGACRATFGYLKMVDASKVKRAVAGKTSTESDPAPAENAGDGNDKGTGEGEVKTEGESIVLNPGDTATLTVDPEKGVVIATEHAGE